MCSVSDLEYCTLTISFEKCKWDFDLKLKHPDVSVDVISMGFLVAESSPPVCAVCAFQYSDYGSKTEILQKCCPCHQVRV